MLEARANGADTVLLIVAVLEVDRLDALIQACRKLDMEPLVEVGRKVPSRRTTSAGIVLIFTVVDAVASGSNGGIAGV